MYFDLMIIIKILQFLQFSLKIYDVSGGMKLHTRGSNWLHKKKRLKHIQLYSTNNTRSKLSVDHNNHSNLKWITQPVALTCIQCNRHNQSSLMSSNHNVNNVIVTVFIIINDVSTVNKNKMYLYVRCRFNTKSNVTSSTTTLNVHVYSFELTFIILRLNAPLYSEQFHYNTTHEFSESVVDLLL